MWAVSDNANYGASFVPGRANLSSVKRYDVPNTSLFTVSSSKYNTAGAVVSVTDASNHTVNIDYTDAFAANGTTLDPALSFVTLAYPTTVKDPDGYSSSMRYNYDFGAATWKQTPLPNVIDNQPGPQQVVSYDSIGRLDRVTSLVNNAYTRYIYGPNYVETFATVNTVADEAHSLQVFDGHGRVIAKATNHPGSVGGFSGQLFTYDQMGQMVKTSNPTETAVTISGVPIQPYNWAAAGDDAQAGWIYTQQTYDWKGRRLVTTNPSTTGNPADTTTKSASYSGCGCAGGEVVTLTDEGTIDSGVAKRRQQKIYSDVIGRTVKTEVLNWEGGSVYSTTVNTYNARDQIKLIRQFQGTAPSDLNDLSCPSGTCQQTTMAFDGYGRLKTKHAPEQQVDPNNPSSTDHTTWTYNPDDTTHSITDARGASATYGYNSRHLVTSVNYSPPAGVTATAAVAFDYDAAGKRRWMTDGSGRVDYTYYSMSRMQSETRQFSGANAPSGSFTLTYGYNLAGQLTSVTDPFNGQVTYQRDSVGRVLTMGASGYTAHYHESNYNEGSVAVTELASNIQYRAWGAVKQITYGNSVSETTSFNTRLQPVEFDLSNVRINNPYAYQPPFNIPSATMTWTYDYYDDGRAHHAYDSQDHAYDRSWAFDHAARMSAALTDREARAESNPDHAGPYQQTIQYDVWNNITSRTGTVFGNPQGDVATYTNNRRQEQYNPFGYDAEGNVLSTVQNTHTYDAGGQQVRAQSVTTVGDGSAQFSVQPAMELNQTYDGKGAPASHDQITRQEIWTPDGSGNPVLTSIDSSEEKIFYVRSTVLGGAILTEVVRDYQGQGARVWTSLYLNGQRIARAGSSVGSVEYEHANPVNGSWITTNGHPNWRMMNRHELDPFGADVGLLAQQYANWTAAGLYTEAANPIDYIDGCFLDGVPIDCNSIWLGTESFAPCWNRNCGPRVRDGKLTQPFQAFADGWAGYLPFGAQYEGNGRWYILQGGTDNDLGKERKVRPEDGDYGTAFGGDLDVSGPQNTSWHDQSTITGTVIDPCADAVVAATPASARSNARRSVPLILDTAAEANLTTAQTAYVLASSLHESQLGRLMTEIWGPTALQAGYEGRGDLGNTQPGDGYRFRGRGFIQITGRKHYAEWSALLGDDLIGNPGLATDPQIAAQIAVYGMQMGQFTGRALDQYINDDGTDFYHARSIVNGDLRKNGHRIAGYAEAYLAALERCK